MIFNADGSDKVLTSLPFTLHMTETYMMFLQEFHQIQRARELGCLGTRAMVHHSPPPAHMPQVPGIQTA